MEVEEPRLRLFMFLLLIIGVIASLYLPAKVMNLTVRIYSGTASPYNIDYMGTNNFYNLLKTMNYSVAVTSTWEETRDSAGNGSVIFIIAPDKPLSRNEAFELYSLAASQNITIVVADENITSNAFTSILGVNVSGHAIFAGIYSFETPFVRAYYNSLINGSYGVSQVSVFIPSIQVHGVSTGLYNKTFYYPLLTNSSILRLNWASSLNFSFNTAEIPGYSRIRYYRIFMVAAGFIDLNDNQRIDDFVTVHFAYNLDERYSLTDNYFIDNSKGALYPIIGVEVGVGRGRVIILSDSFFFTNQALTMEGLNTSYIGFIRDLLAYIRPTQVIIDNSHYKANVMRIGIPFHPAILLYTLSNGLHIFDNILTSIISGNEFLAFALGVGITLIVVLILQQTLGLKSLKAVKVREVGEIVLLSETSVRRDLYRKGGIEPRRAVVELWRLTDYVLGRTIGIGLDKAVSSREALEKISKLLGISSLELEKQLKWMHKIYLKASGKRRLPLIFLWRRTLLRYISKVEKLLEQMGYSITRKAGYRGVEEILH